MNASSRFQRVLATIVAVGVAVVLAACGDSAATEAGSAASEPAVPEQAAAEEVTASQPVGSRGEAQAGADHFFESLIASAPPADPDGPEAQAAWDHLPKSRQTKLSEDGSGSLHAGMAGYLEIDVGPDDMFMAELQEFDEMIRQAVFSVSISGPGGAIELSVTFKRTTCDLAASTSGASSSNVAGTEACQKQNVQPWKIVKFKKLG
jgi:hypothetical protein